MPDPNIPDYWFLDPVLIFAAIVGFGIVMLVGMLIQRVEARQQRAYRDRKEALQDDTRVSATDRLAAPPTPTLRGPTQEEPAVRVEVQEEDQVVLVGQRSWRPAILSVRALRSFDHIEVPRIVSQRLPFSLSESKRRPVFSLRRSTNTERFLAVGRDNTIMGQRTSRVERPDGRCSAGRTRGPGLTI